MTRRDALNKEYFAWLYNIVCGNRLSESISYRKLLSHLHDTEFRYLIPRDRNREEDGVDLRHRFIYESGYDNELEVYLDKPCSVLEMMIALAFRCEEWLDDPDVGDRTAQWFWHMLKSLDLGYMSDLRYDKRIVETNINRMLDRDYEPNGKGGLFTIKRCVNDLREAELWHQLCWYMDSITGDHAL